MIDINHDSENKAENFGSLINTTYSVAMCIAGVFTLFIQ
jgi:hypothetical protein